MHFAVKLPSLGQIASVHFHVVAVALTFGQSALILGLVMLRIAPRQFGLGPIGAGWVVAPGRHVESVVTLRGQMLRARFAVAVRARGGSVALLAECRHVGATGLQMVRAVLLVPSNRLADSDRAAATAALAGILRGQRPPRGVICH